MPIELKVILFYKKNYLEVSFSFLFEYIKKLKDKNQFKATGNQITQKNKIISFK